MKIRLIDVDSKIANFALMKISAFFKAKGDDVDWYFPLRDFGDTDEIWMSKVFSFTKDYHFALPEGAKIHRGGTGYDPMLKLPDEIENCGRLDYSIYPDCDYSIVFTTRGCIRHCQFCIVPKKEGLIHNISLTNINPKGKWLMVLDNNFFSNPTWRQNLAYLRSINQPIDFNTGIDLRILTEEQCLALSNCKIKQIHCAWDNYDDKEIILPKLKMLCRFVKPYKITTYILVGFKQKEIIDTDIERALTLRKIGVNPFAMGYMDFNDPTWKKSRSVIDFCRWVNMKATFKKVSWEEYRR